MSSVLVGVISDAASRTRLGSDTSRFSYVPRYVDTADRASVHCNGLPTTTLLLTKLKPDPIESELFVLKLTVVSAGVAVGLKRWPEFEADRIFGPNA